MFSIAQFGSVCRDTNDSYSDKDLLIVCAVRDRKYYYEKFSREGYSVSTFSESQLYNMKKKGSLFLQHLKHEAKILVDENGLFSNFLKDCNLISPTKDEIYNCKKTIEDLYSWNNDIISIAWKADFLYGSSRDYLIKLLAKNGIFAFGLESIIEKCSDFFYIEPKSFQPLQSLRRVKAAYRNNMELPENIFIIKAINDWLNTLEQKLGFDYDSSCYSDFFIQKRLLSNYERLRYLEVIYISLVWAGYRHERHNEIVNFILQPNLYQSLKKNKTKYIEKYLNELCPIYKGIDLKKFKIPLKSNVLVQGI